MNKLKWAALSMVIIFFSCIKEIENTTAKQQDLKEKINEDFGSQIVLGNKLENPYSVINMKKAWESLSKNSKISKNGKIETTHLYVKFMPKTEMELSILKKDSTLTLYDIPLDYEVKENGDFYHDPEVPIDQPTYQYAAIPVDKKLPSGVEYEILEELFIPDEDGDNKETSKTFASKATVGQLVDESLKLTGNLEENEVGSSLSAKSKWRPAGTIRVYDHVTRSFVGVSGVQVRARRWFTTRKGFSDNNGRYSCDGRFRRDANYSIKWDRYEYSIRSGTIGQAILNGPKRRGDWNVDLGNRTSTTVNDKQQYYALIHQGALDYYYGSRFGLTSPPRNSFLKRQLKIAARTENGKSSYVKARRIWFGADISLHAWNRRSDQVYGTIIHELAHAAHRQVDSRAYNDVVWDAYTGPCTSFNGCNNLGPTGNNNRRLLETWPTTVEIMFTTNRYRSRYGRAGYDLDNYQFQRIVDENHYTSAGWDMLDNVNQRTLYGAAFPNDRVSGYSIVQLEQALKGARTWTGWRDNIRSRYANTTEGNLNELFANWPN
ncbi:MAG: hypothetical protein COA50_05485 [Flavobacteriaceae bacterium]|nr:MAG: hypothetical protein COA50_05485 [Flavobacteriaceae bacterium]